MAVFKKFRAGVALETFQTIDTNTSNNTYNIMPYTDLEGRKFSSLYLSIGQSYPNSLLGCSPYSTIVPVATSDELESYNFDDYQILGVGNTTFTDNRNLNDNFATRTMVVTINNSNDEDIIVKCIKFKKKNILLLKSHQYRSVNLRPLPRTA